MSQFVVCFATSDETVANLHAYRRGDTSLRDDNHVNEIMEVFGRGNEGKILLEPPAADERVMFEFFCSVTRTRGGTSTYRDWGYRRIEPCPFCVAEAGMDIYRQFKHILRETRKRKIAKDCLGDSAK